MKQIRVRDSKGNPHIYRFTAESVKAMEARGFDLNLIATQPMTQMPILIEGALLAEEGANATPELALDIYQAQKDKQGLITKLIQMYNEPIDSLYAVEGNAEWEYTD